MKTQNGAEKERATSNSDKAGVEKPSQESQMFAASLRAWRLVKGLTQDELAEKSGVSKSSISMAERAFHFHPPKEITQSRLAHAIGITLGELRSMPSGFESHYGQTLLRPAIEPIAAPVAVVETSRGVQKIVASPLNAREMDSLSLPAKWVLGATDEPAELRYLVVTDAAMQPTIKVGDVAILEPFDSPAPGIYLVGARDWDSVTPIGIRRVTPAANGKIRLSCDNERFDRTPSPTGGESTLIAKVLFVVRAIEPE